MLSQLSGSEQRTNDCISRPPPVHKSGWWDVRSMPSSTAKAAREPNGNVKVTRDGEPSVLDVSLDNNP
jgi:hypothetical protein